MKQYPLVCICGETARYEIFHLAVHGPDYHVWRCGKQGCIREFNILSHRQQEEDKINHSKSKALAVVLALFLGGFGAHKFYMGHLGWGVLYLLLLPTFIPMIVAFLEALSYISMSNEKFQNKCKFG